MSEPPPYTILQTGYTLGRDYWMVIRKRGGQQLRITIPKALDSEGVRQLAIEVALSRIRELPSGTAI